MSVPAPIRALAFLGAVMLLSGCETVSYYLHVSTGQLKLLSEREPVEDVLEALESRSDEEALRLAERLRLSMQVLAFAETQIGLAADGRYSSFVELDKEAVVWNLFAAPELSLSAHSWCYPFVGCAPYRGYFDREKAEQARERMAATGYETHVAGVLAYSTLGWFDDPLLSTFATLSEGAFVELLIHELVHSRVWVKGDAVFNESFASFVGRQGVEAWFTAGERPSDFAAYLAEEAAWARAEALLGRTRAALDAVFTAEISDAQKRLAKARVLDQTAACLESLAATTGAAWYLNLIPRLNNAYLASLATYSDRMTAFAALFRESGNDWPEFFRRVDALAGLDQEARSAGLEELEPSGQQQIAAGGDHQGADEVQCEAFPSHGLDAEPAR
jgi:predicted aminopeptidase